MADDCQDGAGDFQALSENVRLNWLPAPYEARTVYYGDPVLCPKSSHANWPDMAPGIAAELNSGAFMLQWFGHGSRFRWGGAGPMFSSKDVPALNAVTAWPITFSYTCWSGYFVNMHKLPAYGNLDQTLGEALLLAGQRGAVADLSPAGQHVGSALLALNQAITGAIFGDAIDRIGPAVDAGKLAYWSQSPAFPDVIDTSVLFGDPATRLRLPPRISAAAGDGNAVIVTWKHVSQVTSYRVYRSARPYFSPDDPVVELAGAVTGPFAADVVFHDGAGSNEDPGRNRFYRVRAANAFGAAADSNSVGEFNFALIPGK